MPLYDFRCDHCHLEALNVSWSFAEFDDFEAKGRPCPSCGSPMRVVPGLFSIRFKPVRNKRGKLIPGSKRGQRRMMEFRYAKRNKRLEALPEDQRRKMESFFSQHGIRKSAPISPEHA